MHTQAASLLIDIEAELRRLDCWDAQPPPTRALASTQPFAVDTLTLPQWLQFIFLPRMYALIAAHGPLPGRCGIAPMAEEYFRGCARDTRPLLHALMAMDDLLNTQLTADGPAGNT
jgi:uncharacterized protein YqcC (DUF446 family)